MAAGAAAQVVLQVVLALIGAFATCCKKDTVSAEPNPEREEVHIEEHERTANGSVDVIFDWKRSIPVRGTTPVHSTMEDMEELDLND